MRTVDAADAALNLRQWKHSMTVVFVFRFETQWARAAGRAQEILQAYSIRKILAFRAVCSAPSP